MALNWCAFFDGIGRFYKGNVKLRYPTNGDLEPMTSAGVGDCNRDRR